MVYLALNNLSQNLNYEANFIFNSLQRRKKNTVNALNVSLKYIVTLDISTLSASLIEISIPGSYRKTSTLAT